MVKDDETQQIEIKAFNTEQSIKRAKNNRTNTPTWKLFVHDKEYVWKSKMDRVVIIRNGLPYDSIEVISKKADLPVKHVLQLLGVPQTTYNKKKKENNLLSGRDSEIILVISEILEFGVQVFNGEKEKFQRWLKKPNLSLGGTSPESLFDSLTGIQEVKNCLNRLEYGNLA
ncbi:MAG: DUF2384 domain-containing protein [Ichthyobacteriaceae bacterium]|nr:DUF2384 domain-containing protein [Ichthyobacteriaceae bacterium]